MVREYTDNWYLRAADAYRRRTSENGRLGSLIEAWRRAIARHWHELQFATLEVEPRGERLAFRVTVHFGQLDPALVRVELYADPIDDGPAVRAEMRPLGPSHDGVVYGAEVQADRPPDHFTPRIVPHHPHAFAPLEDSHILWYR
jgi:starch phosphorylase